MADTPEIRCANEDCRIKGLCARFSKDASARYANFGHTVGGNGFCTGYIWKPARSRMRRDILRNGRPVTESA